MSVKRVCLSVVLYSYCRYCPVHWIGVLYCGIMWMESCCTSSVLAIRYVWCSTVVKIWLSSMVSCGLIQTQIVRGMHITIFSTLITL